MDCPNNVLGENERLHRRPSGSASPPDHNSPHGDDEGSRQRWLVQQAKGVGQEAIERWRKQVNLVVVVMDDSSEIEKMSGAARLDLGLQPAGQFNESVTPVLEAVGRLLRSNWSRSGPGE